MVESLYALENFVTVANKFIENGNYRGIGKGINIESITGFNCMEQLITSEWGQQLDEIVIGRSDLAASCHQTVDSPEIMVMARKICDTAKANGKRVSLGGQITSSNIENVVEHINPTQIHTRMLIIDPKKMSDKSACIKNALKMEVFLMNLMKIRLEEQKQCLSCRIDDVMKRI